MADLMDIPAGLQRNYIFIKEAEWTEMYGSRITVMPASISSLI